MVSSPRITLSSDLAKVALAFGQYLDSLSKPQCYASEASKAVYRNLPEAKDILNRHYGKLKVLVTKCPYLSLKGGPHGGTYLLVLDVKLFHELNKKGWTREQIFVLFVRSVYFKPKKGWTVVGQFVTVYM